MRKNFALAAMLVSLVSLSAFADDEDMGRCPGPDCKVKTKKVCFNLQCTYGDHHENETSIDPEGGHDRNCRAAATFVKAVTKDGGEVSDDSNSHNNPRFEVKCGKDSLTDNSARRFTTLLGTRIQREQGPFPAILLPRGALHSGSDNLAGFHVAKSVLEVDTGHKVKHLHGTCYIWTGNP